MKPLLGLEILLLLLITLVFSCTKEKNTDAEGWPEETRFQLLSPGSTQVTFENRIAENDTFNMVDFFYVYNGGGVAVGDINNDSLSDIYFTGNMVNDRLYLNRGNMRFEDVTDSAGIDYEGWSTGVTMVDINHDGFLDIYVCRSGNYSPDKRKNLLYVNSGDGTFEERAETFGLADEAYSTQAAFFDYDKDGDLDMYLLNHTNDVRDPNNVRALIADGTGPANDRLYRNEEKETGNLTFTDVSQQSGIQFDGMGLGLGVADVNSDGWEDVFVTNDFMANDYLYINNHDGTFEQSSQQYLDHVSHFSMGNDMADFNNDGRIDLVTADMLPRNRFHEKKMSGPLNYDLFEFTLQQGYMPQYMRNTLQLNRGQIGQQATSFSEIGQLAGIDATDWSWAPLFADFDNDGRKDLFISNGYLRDITDLDFINYTGSLAGEVSPDSLDSALKRKAKEMPSIKLSNFMFRNSGQLDFEDVSSQWGLDQASLSNGAAYSDLDNDGDLDVVVNNINAPASIYENRSEKLSIHFLGIHLKGDSLNLDAMGAEVRIYQQTKKQVLTQSVTRGYQSSVDPRLHFGLGNNASVDSLEVLWPDGKLTSLYDLETDRYLVLDKATTASSTGLTASKKSSGKTSRELSESASEDLFQNVTATYLPSFEHHEEDYPDFNRQFLLPRKHSRQGPGIAISDIDGNGQEDFFTGGGYQHSGQLFYRKGEVFEQKPLISNEAEKYEEDTGVLFFDYDNDGDQDLYIVSGSNEFYENSEYYQDRLYQNDGKGNFELDVAALPNLRTSGSCVRAADFDQDGDLDLFVGGRLVPLKYPLPPKSYLLQNNGGKFSDVTNQLAPSLRKPGMVTDALWTDFDNDMDTDLIVVGEFMAIEFYENTGGKLNNVSSKAGPTQTAGWWNSIVGGDFDNDGDTDYVLGNWGLNTKYEASGKEPITVYGLDYDRNGAIDPIMSAFVNGIEYPTHSRDDLIKQIPGMKKKFPDYASYARATLDTLLTAQEKSNAYQVKAFRLASSYLKNDGAGRFQLIDLPIEAQFAPVYGILIEDFDKDGFLDLLLSGNDFGTEVGSGRYDASKGTYLKGDGEGGFKSIDVVRSNLSIDGDNRGAALLRSENKSIALFGQNSGPLKAFRQSAEAKRFIDVAPETLKAKITDRTGKIRWTEFYYGSSYLSQSSRKCMLYSEDDQIELYDFRGKKTTLEIPLEFD